MTLLVVGSTYSNKIRHFLTVKRLGLTLALLAEDCPTWLHDIVDDFLLCNPYSAEACKEVIGRYSYRQRVSGVLTFTDRFVEIAGSLARYLGTPSSPESALRSCRHKGELRQALSSSPYYVIRNREDVLRASARVPLPAILKPVSSTSSRFIYRVSSSKEIMTAFLEASSHAVPESDPLFSFYTGEFILEPYLSGLEVSVEGVCQNGTICFYGVTDKWIEDVHFQEVRHRFPSALTQKAKAAILKCAEAGLQTIGFQNGAFHIELKIQNEDIRIIEINGRLAGDHIADTLVPLVASVDPVVNAIRAAVGLPIIAPECSNREAAIEFLLCNRSGVISERLRLEILKECSGYVTSEQLISLGSTTAMPPASFSKRRLCYIIALSHLQSAISSVSLVSTMTTTIQRLHSSLMSALDCSPSPPEHAQPMERAKGDYV